MSRGMQGPDPREAVPMRHGYVDCELGEGEPIEGDDGCPGGVPQRPGVAAVVCVIMRYQDSPYGGFAVAQDILQMRMVCGSRIDDQHAVGTIIDQPGIGTVIGHRTGVAGDYAPDARQDRLCDASRRRILAEQCHIRPV